MPVLYLTNPAGVTPQSRRMLLDRLRDLHMHAAEQLGDADVDARIAQYEMSYRMQASVPGVMDVSTETEETFALYGPDAKKPGTLRGQLPAGASSRRARREVHPALSPGLGSARQPAEGHRAAVPRDRSGQRRAGHRPEASRSARRHARGVGRGVRPHQLLTGQADGHQLRARPPSALLLDLDGGRRRQGRAMSTAPPTTSPTTSSMAACTSTTCTRRCCGCWASITNA